MINGVPKPSHRFVKRGLKVKLRALIFGIFKLYSDFRTGTRLYPRSLFPLNSGKTCEGL